MQRIEVLFKTRSQRVSLQPQDPDSVPATPTNLKRKRLVQAALIFIVIIIVFFFTVLFVVALQKPRHEPAAQTSQEFLRDNSTETPLTEAKSTYHSRLQEAVQKLKDQVENSSTCSLEIQMLRYRVDNVSSQIQLLSGHLENSSAGIQMIEDIVSDANTLRSQTQLLGRSLEGAATEIQKLKQDLNKVHVLTSQTQSLFKSSSENTSVELHMLHRGLENANTEIQGLKAGLEKANAQAHVASVRSANVSMHILNSSLSCVNDLKTQNQLLRSSLEGVTAEVQKIKGNLQNANVLNSQTQSFIRNSLNTTSAEIQLLKGRLERTGDESHLLKKDLEKVTAETQQTNSHLEQTNVELQGLKREVKNISALSPQIQALIGQFKNAKAEVQMLKQGMKGTETLDSKTQMLERNLQEATAEIQRLRKSLANATAIASKIQGTQSDLQSLRTTLASQEKLQRTQSQLLQLFLQGWKAYNGNLYFFSIAQKSWHKAEEFCVSKGAHLTSVITVEEQNFLKQYTQKSYYWIGLTDSGTEGSWRWADETPFNADQNKKFWAKNQPDNWRHADGKFEDCVQMEQAWNDMKCDSLFKWICKKPFSEHGTLQE